MGELGGLAIVAVVAIVSIFFGKRTAVQREKGGVRMHSTEEGLDVVRTDDAEN